jgi:hypothetical protein
LHGGLCRPIYQVEVHDHTEFMAGIGGKPEIPARNGLADRRSYVITDDLSQQAHRAVLHSRSEGDVNPPAIDGGNHYSASARCASIIHRGHHGHCCGLAIVLVHNVWSGGLLHVVITVIGWLSLMKGLLFVFLTPEMGAIFLDTMH